MGSGTERNRRRHLSASDSALPQPRSQHWIGSGVVALGATTFGLVTTQSRLAYDGGSNTLTVVLVRATTFALLFGAFLLFRRPRARLSWSGFLATLWMGALLLVMSAGYLGAVAYIPVSLAALIFYTFPFYVAILASLTGREPMTRLKAAALVAAFAGLVLALGPSFDVLNWRGIACGVGGRVRHGHHGHVRRYRHAAERSRSSSTLARMPGRRSPSAPTWRDRRLRPADDQPRLVRHRRRHAVLHGGVLQPGY